MKKKIILCVAAFIVLLTVPVAAFEPYESYTYDKNLEIQPGPNGYTPTKVENGVTMGIGALKNPSDIFVYDEKNEIYIADTGNKRVIVVDSDFNFIKEIKSYVEDGAEVELVAPKGIFVDETGIYIADTDANRIVQLGFDGEFISKITKPTSAVFQSETFAPTKVLRDDANNIYALSTGTYQGVVTFDRNREFSGYIGSVPVELTFKVLSEYVWKKIMTEDQINSMARNVPVEYSGIDIDSEGFIYTVFTPESVGSQKIYKLSTAGKNIYPMPITQGDTYSYMSASGVVLRTYFTDICVDDSGYVFAVDNTESRVFMYDSDGNMVFTFGGLGNQMGHFQLAAAIDTVGSDVLVLDSSRANITVFHPTEVCQKIRMALELYSDGRYSEAIEPWEEVLAYNSNFSLAYRGLGNAMLEMGEYEKALDYYELGMDKDGYSQAFEQYRLNFITENYLPLIIAALIIIILATVIVKYRSAKQLVEASKGVIRSGQRYIVTSGRWKQLWFIERHPLIGFDDMSFYDMGSLPIAFGIIVVWIAATCLTHESTGFLFSTATGELNILIVLLQTAVLFFVFCFSNRIFAVMVDGRGTLKNIICSTAYALVPMLITTFAAIPISHLVTQDEGLAYTGIVLLGQLITALYIFISQKRIHEVSGPTCFLLLFLTLFGIAFALFVAVLTYSLFTEVYNLIAVVIEEILLRI